MKKKGKKRKKKKMKKENEEEREPNMHRSHELYLYISHLTTRMVIKTAQKLACLGRNYNIFSKDQM